MKVNWQTTKNTYTYIQNQLELPENKTKSKKNDYDNYSCTDLCYINMDLDKKNEPEIEQNVVPRNHSGSDLATTFPADDDRTRGGIFCQKDFVDKMTQTRQTKKPDTNRVGFFFSKKNIIFKHLSIQIIKENLTNLQKNPAWNHIWIFSKNKLISTFFLQFLQRWNNIF